MLYGVGTITIRLCSDAFVCYPCHITDKLKGLEYSLHLWNMNRYNLYNHY